MSCTKLARPPMRAWFESAATGRAPSRSRLPAVAAIAAPPASLSRFRREPTGSTPPFDAAATSATVRWWVTALRSACSFSTMSASRWTCAFRSLRWLRRPDGSWPLLCGSVPPVCRSLHHQTSPPSEGKPTDLQPGATRESRATTTSRSGRATGPCPAELRCITTVAGVHGTSLPW